MRVEKWIDEMVPMTDKIIGEEMSVVTATRNSVDVRKWVASRLMPNQYGDQPSGVTINNQTNIVMVSEERQRELQAVRQRMIEQQKEGRGLVRAETGLYPRVLRPRAPTNQSLFRSASIPASITQASAGKTNGERFVSNAYSFF